MEVEWTGLRTDIEHQQMWAQLAIAETKNAVTLEKTNLLSAQLRVSQAKDDAISVRCDEHCQGYKADLEPQKDALVLIKNSRKE